MSKKKRNMTTEKEGYIVKYNYQKPDGYWEIGKEEEVLVETTFDKEKDNHQGAIDKLFSRFEHMNISKDKVKIISVSYV